MITGIKLPGSLNFNQNFTGYTIDDITLDGEQTLYFHIGATMPNIPKASTLEDPVKKRSDGMKSCILNDAACRPDFNTIHQSIDYITAKKAANNEWDGRRIVLENGDELVNNGTKFEVFFLHGCLKDCQYTTTRFKT